jgi:predicted MFS family arabinose efflux permease
MLANFLWGKLSSQGNDKLIIILSFAFNILAYSSLVFFKSYYLFFAVFFLVGASIDGFRLAFSNLLLSRAPDNHRPAYVAIYNNIIAIGLFFAIPGGVILDLFGFRTLNLTAVVLLCIGLVSAFFLHRDCKPMT